MPHLEVRVSNNNNIEIELALVKLFEEDINLERKSDVIKSNYYYRSIFMSQYHLTLGLHLRVDVLNPLIE